MSAERGFSLLEVMVSLAVFSLGALALINVLGESGRVQAATAERSIALQVAENRLAEALAASRPPAPGTSSGKEQALARAWDWDMRVAPTPDPRILRIDVAVRAEAGKQVLAELSTFRAASR